MIEEFKKYIHTQKMFPSGSKVLLAVSGGMDSVLLCELFYRCGFRFAIAHCNFGLRGKESDGDESFVRRLATKYKVEFFVNRFDTESYATQQKLSIQEAARNLRYEWFEKIRRTHRFACIATAHHQNDNTETFFINLLRGTGLEGLKGIPPKNGKIIRPILFASRQGIEQFARQHRLKWRHDSSNDSSDYLRNRIRQELIPLLETLQPAFEKVMLNNRQHFAEAWLLLEDWAAEKSKGALLTSSRGILKIDLAALPSKQATYLLYSLLKEKGFRRSQAEAMIQASPNRAAGRVFHSDSFEALLDRKILLVRKKKKESVVARKITAGTRSFRLPTGNWKITRKKERAYEIPRSSATSCLDVSRLSFPLTVRRWQDGDAFYPLGMKGRKKVSDFLVDNKVSLFGKENIFVILSGNDIICIPGHRIDNRFKVTSATKEILVIEPTNNE